MLSRFLNSSIATELAAAKSMYREIDFLLPWPGQQSPLPHETDRPTTLIAGVIDLLVESETGWHVLDYKTGDFNHQTSDEQLLRPYELQLGVYAYAVEQWFGAVPCELSLITFKPEIRRISLNWTKARWDRIRTRVDLAITSIKRPEGAVRGDRR